MYTLVAFCISLMTLVWSSVVHANARFNMTPGVTVVSRDVHDLHMIIFWICVAIGIVVFGIMFYTIVMHRKSKGYVAAKFHEHFGVEIAWAIAPLLILILMAIPATKVMFRIADTSNSELTIKITGHQWKWEYEYLDQGIRFFSNLSTPRDQIENIKTKGEHYLLEVDKPLVLPVNKKIRFLMTSNDVIHSWWVPSFAVKKDAVPGFIHATWTKIETPGTYRGQCAELCGQGHGFMPIVVEAKSEEEFQRWLAEQTAAIAKAQASSEKEWTKEELIAAGEKIYNTQCAVCHKPDGSGMPPVFPSLVGTHVATGDVAKHIDIVLNGVSGTAMQAFGKQLNDADIAAVITYERTAWGNEAKNATKKQAVLVQPSEVKTHRKNN